MVCIWSTTVRLTWGVASLRAIIRNMHTWSSRLLKPKLQAAILQASTNLRICGQVDAQHPSSRHLPIITVNRGRISTANSSPIPSSHISRATPVNASTFRKPVTPKRLNAPASQPRIDTPTWSTNPEDSPPRRNSPAEETQKSKNDVFGPSNG